MRDVAADIDDFGGKLVAKNLRQGRSGEDVRRGGRDDGTGDIFVEISAADAGPQRLHQELVRPHVLWLVDGFDADVFSSVIANSLHGRSSLYSWIGRNSSLYYITGVIALKI